MFLLHSDNLHTYAFVWPDVLHYRLGPYFSDRRIYQQLNESAKRRRLSSTNEQPAQAKVLQRRNGSLAAILPSHKCALGRVEARVTAGKLFLACHGRPLAQDTPVYHGAAEVSRTVYSGGI